jgi:Fe-S-cluster-containing dehydrogenase component
VSRTIIQQPASLKSNIYGILENKNNWNDPVVPKGEMTKRQHYLGNRMRGRGQMEKCTFCVQRSRAGRLPACVEACPTGARVFGNLLDPDSEIRFVLKNKKVFRWKEDLGTDPKFWYFID